MIALQGGMVIRLISVKLLSMEHAHIYVLLGVLVLQLVSLALKQLAVSIVLLDATENNVGELMLRARATVPVLLASMQEES
jgi:hypothetical protein